MRTFILCFIVFGTGGIWGIFIMSLFSARAYKKGYEDAIQEKVSK
jgi:hypothetical protein